VHSVLIVENLLHTQVINNKLNTVWECEHIEDITFSREDNDGSWFRFKVRDKGSFEYKEFRLNKHTDRIDIYDIIRLGNGYSLIGTEQNLLCKSNSMVEKRLLSVKYKLAHQGYLITNKCYNDIVAVPGMKNSEYFYCFNETYSGRFMGLLDKDGNEIVAPIYTNITHLANGVFMLTELFTKRIFNARTGYMSVEVPEKYMYMHGTLPIVLSYEDKEWKVYDGLGRIFKLIEINKYFDCKYCAQYADLIKININIYSNDAYYKYITNNLSVVTDTNIINKLNSLEWV
jgi:hypothetical protein